jgi:hypothetical protein
MRDAIGVVTDFTARAKKFGMEVDDALALLAAPPPSFLTIRTIGDYARYEIGAPPLPQPSHLGRSMAVHLCANDGDVDPASIFSDIAYRKKNDMEEAIVAFDVTEAAAGAASGNLRRVVLPQIISGAVELWCVIDFVPGSVPLDIRCIGSIEAYGVRQALKEALDERMTPARRTCREFRFPRDAVTGNDGARSAYWLLDKKTPMADAAATLKRLEAEPAIEASFNAAEAKR